jgi:hypothetical protein
MVFKNSLSEIEEYITLQRNEKNPIQPFILKELLNYKS